MNFIHVSGTFMSKLLGVYFIEKPRELYLYSLKPLINQKSNGQSNYQALFLMKS